MSGTVKQPENTITRQVLKTLTHYPDLVRQLPVGTVLHHVQPSRYDTNPVHYHADSDTRYADPAKQVGVYYLGFTEEVALAESFQPEQGVDDPVHQPLAT
jgi:RES domain.